MDSIDLRNFQGVKATPGAPGTVGPEILTGEVPKTTVTTEQVRDPITQDTPTAKEEEDLLTDSVIDEYLAYLADFDITEEDTLNLLAVLIADGTIYWDWKLLGHIPVTFKVRQAWHNEHLNEVIEKLNPTTYARFTELVGLHNLAGSLVKYGKQTFRPEDEKGLAVVLNFINTQPYIIREKLHKQLCIFDRLIAVATSDRVVANFTKLQLAASEQK